MKNMFVPGKQCGQAIIYIVAMLPAIFLSVLLIYNTATVTREKMSLQNTADATTYSAGVVVARNLNFLSYTNRAMAANESGIATLASMQTSGVTLVTTVANLFEVQALIYGKIAAVNFVQSLIPSPAAPIYKIRWLQNTVKAQRAMNNAKKIARVAPAVGMPFRLGVDLLRALNYGIAASQTAMYVATLGAIPTTVKDVMEKNDPQASLPVVDNIFNIGAFATQYISYIRPYHQEVGPGSEKDRFDEALRFAHVAQAMRDDFTKNRRILPGFLTEGNFTGKIVKFLTGFLMEWKGGTELVSEKRFNTSSTGRIRWHSADALYIKAPISELLGDIIPIRTRATDYQDFAKFRFGLGAGAAAQGGPFVNKSWSGSRITLPAEGQVARDYGGLNDSNAEKTVAKMDRSAFDRAVNSADRPMGWTNPSSWAAFLQGAVWHYKSRQDIGLATSNWYMPPFYEVRTHPQMKEDESDNFIGQQAISGANPLKWGSKINRGPIFSLSMEKKAGDSRTGEQIKVGRADGVLGLKDNYAKNGLKVLSSTQVYFRRPQDRWQRRDLGKADVAMVGKYKLGFTGGYIEHRNLFSPYWHVHHVQPSTATRLVANGTALIGNSGDDDWSPASSSP